MPTKTDTHAEDVRPEDLGDNAPLSEIQKEILELKEQRNAIILGHYYQKTRVLKVY